MQFLPLLNKHITLRIPNFTYIAKDKSFAGYKYIAGVPLTKKVLKSLLLKEKKRCAKQLAQFLNQLHGIRKGKGGSVLTHQDLIDEHILFDAKSKRIVGIIDFGDLAMADRARDFARLWRYEDEGLVDMILCYYKTKDKTLKATSKQLFVGGK